MAISVDIEGMDQLQAKLAELAAVATAEAEEVLVETGDAMADRMREGAPVDTGFLRDSIGMVIGSAEVHVGVILEGAHPDTGTDAYYAGFFEFGDRPFIVPAFEAEAHGLERRINEAISRAVGE